MWRGAGACVKAGIQGLRTLVDECFKFAIVIKMLHSPTHLCSSRYFIHSSPYSSSCIRGHRSSITTNVSHGSFCCVRDRGSKSRSCSWRVQIGYSRSWVIGAQRSRRIEFHKNANWKKDRGNWLRINESTSQTQFPVLLQLEISLSFFLLASVLFCSPFWFCTNTV